jgi:hypothetical protein
LASAGVRSRSPSPPGSWPAFACSLRWRALSLNDLSCPTASSTWYARSGDGYLYPWTFSIHDFEPMITGRIHQPPPSHQTFQGRNFVICSFCPRKLDFDPSAIPIPYHHSNLQSEEMIYYVSGNFGSRRGVRRRSSR